MNTHHHRHLLLVAALAVGACAETIDEEPLTAGEQRRTMIEQDCSDAGEDCDEAVALESAESKDADVIDVIEFGAGFILVEAVGPGSTRVVARSADGRWNIEYEVSEAAGALQVEETNVQRVAPN